MSTDTDIGNQSNDISKPPSDQYAIRETQLGIWKLFIATRKGGRGAWQAVWETYPFVIRLFVEIYKVSPQLLIVMFLSMCWNGFELSLDMQIENILLKQIERSINGRANMRTTLFATGWKVVHTILDFSVRWSDNSVVPALENRLKQHFKLELMNSRLLTDLPTSTETSEREIDSELALFSLKNLFATVQSVLQISSQVIFLLKITGLRGTKMLLSVVLLQAMVAAFSPPALWRLPFFTYISNEAYQRIQSLESFGNGNFRQDIISHNLGNWIATEYKKAFAALGDVSPDQLFSQYYRTSSLFKLQDSLGVLPSIYFAFLAVKYPRYLSFASITTLRASGRTLFGSVKHLYTAMANLPEGVHTLSKMYTPKTPNIMKDGRVCLTEKEETSSKGMSLVLKNVSFAYPGEKNKNALSDVNLDIKAGQLVIIVGVNGSGKSTLTRILARLYDPSSGEFIIEGRPSTDYRIADLHRAIALLSQDSQIYPLSMAENIGLGYPERSTDLEMIKEAAQEGGAAEFIEGLANGYQTMLKWFGDPHHNNLKGNREHPLWVMSQKLKKKSDISGGQRQRIIAARTFMGFKSGKVKLAIIDEPSSALDADAELHLFQRLMSVREGKTIVIVTHRFGHLTKFADQIICMKDGTIVERGSHGELMSADGEYANLYKIQAQAFSEGNDPPAVGSKR